MAKKMTVYVPVGLLGYGFPVRSLEAAMAQEPDFIAVDAGSTDPGPYYLGAGVSFTSREMVKRDLSLIVPAARGRNIPLIIGSAGGAGGRPHLEWCLEILKEVATECGLPLQTALIDAEQDKEYVKAKIRSGDVIDFEAGWTLTEEDVDESVRIVGQMGTEPVARAVEAGADVVLAGRAFDAGLIAALPIQAGFDPGLAYHMGKILECGSLIATPMEADGAVGVLEDGHFLVKPADPEKTTNVRMVAAHTMYEKTNPMLLKVPGGTIDLREAEYEQIDDRCVKVSRSHFIQEPYTIKLEGAKLVGYRNVCVAGTRDPGMVENIDEVINTVREKLKRDLEGRVAEDEYQVIYHVYGKNGVMGALEPQRNGTAHELGIVIETVAKTQQLADTVASLARSSTLHCDYPGRIATAGNLAFISSPAEFPAGEVYEFNVYHLIRVDDPGEPFVTETVQI